MKTLKLFFSLLAATTLALSAVDDDTSKYVEFAKQFEVAERPAPPKWAARKTPPLFRVAWLTDQHIVNPISTKMTVDAFKYIREHVQPKAIFITGDNIGTNPHGTAHTTPTQQRQKDMQTLLKKRAGDTPFWIIPGDNWHMSFERVFGSSHYSFDFGGFHFIFNTVDVTGNKNGCSRFNENTWRWLREDLAAHSRQPIIYLQHEPCLPPSFLDAPQLADLFKKTPNLILALAGHLHLDLEFQAGHWSQWVGPSLGRSHRPAFKVLSFYPDQIVATSIEWDNSARDFRPTNKFQRVKIPEQFRGILYSPALSEGAENYNELPPAPREINEMLDQLEPTIMQNVKSFGVRFAVQRLIPKKFK